MHLGRSWSADAEHGHGHEHPHGTARARHRTGTRTGTAPHGSEGGAPSRRGLIAIGLAGGLLPSPSALLVLLGAVALGHPWFGVALVVAFGLGMAATLAVVGLVVMRLRERAERRLRQPPGVPVRAGAADRAALTAVAVVRARSRRCAWRGARRHRPALTGVPDPASLAAVRLRRCVRGSAYRQDHAHPRRRSPCRRASTSSAPRCTR